MLSDCDGAVRIGIDPGKKGGFAVLIDGKVWKAEVWDDAEFVDTMRQVSQMRTVARAAVEKVGAMPHQGTVSMFNFGKSCGFIEGVLATLDIPYQLISPQKWKAEFGLNSDKQKSIEVCHKLFPDVDLLATPRCKKPSDGKAESILLCEYARRKL